MERALQYLDRNRDRFLELLFDYLKIPSVSAQKEHGTDCRVAASFLQARLEEAGFQAGQHEGEGLPCVHGSLRGEGPRPALVLYGHYDVQPAEPFELWETPPFHPTVVDGEIRARGAADDKGPSLALVFAAECWRKATGSVPVDLFAVMEGEEECGGTVIEDYLEENKGRIQAEAVVIADTAGAAKGVPALCYGLRGLAGMEAIVKGPSRDLHSGTYGGTIANPATALARMLATLHDEKGHVAVEGFYDGVVPLSAAEKERIAAQPFDERSYLGETGSPALFGEEGYTTYERKGARPTCEINGLSSGYTGEGIKTIVPALARAKITCRLVPGQDPRAVQSAVRRHLERHTPPGVACEVVDRAVCPAIYADPETDWGKRARAALREAFGKPCVLSREGGSIPVVAAFHKLWGLSPILLGTYAPGERAHSPNERYLVEDFFKGIRAGIALFAATSSGEAASGR